MKNRGWLGCNWSQSLANAKKATWTEGKLSTRGAVAIKGARCEVRGCKECEELFVGVRSSGEALMGNGLTNAQQAAESRRQLDADPTWTEVRARAATGGTHPSACCFTGLPWQQADNSNMRRSG